MCYMVYLSTDTSDDLSRFDSELIAFERYGAGNEESFAGLLTHPNRWFVRWSPSACSCEFRHVQGEQGFREPEDWFPEDPDQINSTKELYTVILSILTSGCQADLVDGWVGASAEDFQYLHVSLSAINVAAFRLFVDYRFTFSA